jgi:hypothetical protein
MISDWVSFLAYPKLFGIKGFVVVVHDDDSMQPPAFLIVENKSGTSC